MWLGETDRPAMTIAADLGRKATKQTNIQTTSESLKAKQSLILALKLL